MQIHLKYIHESIINIFLATLSRLFKANGTKDEERGIYMYITSSLKDLFNWTVNIYLSNF